jgi:hypothetical protein
LHTPQGRSVAEHLSESLNLPRYETSPDVS